MVNIKTLLPDLKELVKELDEDLLARAIGNPEIDAGLREAFTQIEKGGRTAQAYEVWREDYLDQVAVAWVLACVFVRFMEDNHLIDECWLAGVGERRMMAEDTHEIFFRQHPHDTDREYFQHVFHEVGKIPASRDLFAEGKTPLWAVAPSGDAAMKLLAYLREIDAERGNLKRSFEVKDCDTRFLGDLYQELSEKAKKKYALLQTPVFVEEFILDRTLNPAIDEFGLDTLRMIDPTCGSGHFLLGGFARLFRLWMKRESNEIVAARKALDGVWGVDINPFAVAIARFRLIVAALVACGIKRLKDAPGWKIHLATGDSLLFGSRWNRSGEKVTEQGWLTSGEGSWAPEIYACEDKYALQEVLGQQYHAVVGNPPYITVKDKSLNDAYRHRYSTCHRKYSLAAPFAERLFDLSIASENGRCGYVGMITANSFMKREFGKKLIEEFFPTIDLTHVLDTSGAYIPGHGTPTVILFGRNRHPRGKAVRAVLGIKGEPSTPEDASKGLVWQSILRQIDQADAQDGFTSTADVPRTTFASHPWSIGGGGATELKELIEDGASRSLGDLTESIGFGAILGEDDAFGIPEACRNRNSLPDQHLRPLIEGEYIRDWSFSSSTLVVFPYDKDINLVTDNAILDFLWPSRIVLGSRADFSKRSYAEVGRPHWEYHQIPIDRNRTPLSIAFAEVASHNHFVLDRGGKVFKQTAPIIKLLVGTTEDDYLSLLGLLNSSVVCFYLKQVSHQKQMMGGDGIRISSRAKVPYQFAGSRLQEIPIPATFAEGPLRERILRLAEHLEGCSRNLGGITAKGAITQGITSGEAGIRALYEEYGEKRRRLRSEMVFLQEEIDFTAYAMYGLSDESLLCDTWDWPTVVFDAGMRPFEILQHRNLDDFPVSKEIPPHWPEELREVWRRRIEAVRSSKDLSLIEDDHYKRRWIGRQGLFNHTARQDELKAACESWLLDRLEGPRYWPDASRNEPALQSNAQLSDKASGDHDFLQVATLYRGRPDFDVAALVHELVEGESVPFLPVLRYKPSGLRKHEVWERTWDLQRKQDAGENVGDIPVPPKYATADFLKNDYWRLRGKLDVPKERWISYPHLQTESDSSLVVGWAGWNHLQQATALVSYYDARKREGWDSKRLTPILAGLDQLLPWIHQWHPEIDPEFGDTAGQSYQSLLENDAHELGLTLDDIRNWEPPAKGGKRKAKG